MRLTIVGCSGSYPGPDSAASCYLVEAEQEGRTWRLVLDLGNGALGTLQRYADPLKIDAVLLSHLHADHCIDLTSYYVLRKYHPTGSQPMIPVYGPEGTSTRLAHAYDLPLSPGMTEEFEFFVYPPTPFQIGPFHIEAIPVAHPVPAYAMRIQADGKLLVYSGDTGACEGLERAVQGADLLLGEASFCEGEANPPDLHLTGKEIAESAVRGDAKMLVLTHIPPWHDPQVAYDEAKLVYNGPLELAETGAVYEL